MQASMYFIQSRTCEFGFFYIGKIINWFIRIARIRYLFQFLSRAIKDRSDKIHSY